MDRRATLRPVFLFLGHEMTKATKRNWKPATELIHGGTLRSQFGETSEAIYMTQGFVYDNSEAAEARFKGEEPGFIYSRYANPTVDMFEKRMCAMEGAEDARATASGMAAVAAALLCSVRAGDHVVATRKNDKGRFVHSVDAFGWGNGWRYVFDEFLALLDADRFEGRFRDGVHSIDPSDLMRRMVKEKLLTFDGTSLGDGNTACISCAGSV